MSLKHTLLGFLNLGTMTGYEMKKYMDQSTQFFWHAGLSQIYPTLKGLERDGLITAHVEPQDGKPDKKTYTITKAGRATFIAWLAEPMTTLPSSKNTVLLKLFFSGSLDKEKILRQLHIQLDLHRARLAQYEAETKPYIDQIATDQGLAREGMMWELVRQLGADYEHTYVRWLEQALETVEREL
jgi:PadR family transcriptional regulator AphA